MYDTPQLNEMGDFLTVKEAADYLKIDPITMYRLLKKGEIACYHILPKKIIVPKTSLKDFLKNSLVLDDDSIDLSDLE